MASLQPQQEGWSALPLELDEPERLYNQQDSEAPKPDISFAAGAIHQSSPERVISEIKGHDILMPSLEALRDLGTDVLNFLSKAEQGRVLYARAAQAPYFASNHQRVYCNSIWPKSNSEESLTFSYVPKLIKEKATQYRWWNMSPAA
ncbi:hypothetical protein MHUMG1_05669 [Metarhizium humberi]|uniref:Uncharacterized protein n=1 Tax=Metarhizium humberi TaxID=2596975 RepID=A0A9P8S6F3_9HYPO|nr:hypothetical protein MHUMG1_05669 [Metarhizium humberi]